MKEAEKLEETLENLNIENDLPAENNDIDLGIGGGQEAVTTSGDTNTSYQGPVRHKKTGLEPIKLEQALDVPQVSQDSLALEPEYLDLKEENPLDWDAM